MKNKNVKKAPKAKKPTAQPFPQPDSFDATTEHEHIMEAEGLFAGLNMPPAISSKDDVLHGLPPYRKRRFYPVDEFPGCPRNWVPSEGKMRSYFVPVVEGEGMWLDFNRNFSHTHHVAVVVSVQGINAITGMITGDERLEQYVEKCPKHDAKFGPNRWCEKCGYHWPKQNYICTNATPNGFFWLDGFRAADGAVRQYLLTAEKMRGVASNIVGEERVHAIGLAFFLSKNKRPSPPPSIIRGCGGHSFAPHFIGYEGVGGIQDMPKNWNYYADSTTVEKHYLGDWSTTSNGVSDQGTLSYECKLMGLKSEPAGSVNCCSTGSIIGGGEKASAFMSDGSHSGILRGMGAIKATKLEVGAGAKIRQQIYDDPEPLDFWREDPSAIICVNYVLEVEAREILNRGRLDLSGSKEGFLQGIPVGN